MITLALCSISFTQAVDFWELRKARLFGENISIPLSQCQNSYGEVGDVGDSGRLRCICMVKVDTTI